MSISAILSTNLEIQSIIHSMARLSIDLRIDYDYSDYIFSLYFKKLFLDCSDV